MARRAWLRHVMAVRGKNKGMAFKDVLKLAKRSYKKGGGMQGGNKFESQPASVGGDSGEDAPAPGNENASKGDAGMGGGEPTEAAQEGGRRRKRRGSRKSRKSRRKSRKGKSRKKSRKGKSRKGRKTKRRRRRRR